jgi:hypothetical protein
VQLSFFIRFLPFIRELCVFLQTRIKHFKLMPTNVISAPSSVSAKYWAELKDLSDNVKLELITLLSSSMTRTEKDIKKDAREKLEAALQKFNTDWGGDGSALEISHELREGIENSRTVEEW